MAERRRVQMTHTDIITSNFHRQTRMSFGNGFNIAVRNETEGSLMFSVFVKSTESYGRLYVDIEKEERHKEMHVAFVYSGRGKYIAAYINGKEKVRSIMIKTLGSRNRDYLTNRILIFGQDQYTWGRQTSYTLRDLHFWRYPLDESVISDIFSSGKTSFFPVLFINL